MVSCAAEWVSVLCTSSSAPASCCVHLSSVYCDVFTGIQGTCGSRPTPSLLHAHPSLAMPHSLSCCCGKTWVTMNISFLGAFRSTGLQLSPHRSLGLSLSLSCVSAWSDSTGSPWPSLWASSILLLYFYDCKDWHQLNETKWNVSFSFPASFI